MSALPQRSERSLLGLAWLVLVGIELLTQLSLKFAGRVTGAFDFSARAFSMAVHTGWIWIAAVSYVAGFFTWMLILDRMRLSRAYPMSAMVFVAMMIVSRLVLHETIGTVQGVGALLIVAGILQLGGAQSHPADGSHPGSQDSP
jgi:drug/metabolite transporter (DMT)-like permease